jgi:hypothetical protein
MSWATKKDKLNIMSIFKKLFGGSEKADKDLENRKPDIEKLINSENINGSIIQLDNYISTLCEYGDNMDLLTDPQKAFYYNQNLEREINNGGFNQFYFNSSGNFAHETIDSLKAIGANKTSEIVKKANDQFPDKKVPKDRAERQNALSLIEEKANEIWEELGQKFFVYEDDLNSLNMGYIKKNYNKF